jgi:hypothetical protein
MGGSLERVGPRSDASSAERGIMRMCCDVKTEEGDRKEGTRGIKWPALGPGSK